MSSTDRPTLSVAVNADPATESASVTADGIRIATVARNSRPACRRALTLLYSCTRCLSPPRRNDAPNMNKVLVTIAPAMDAFTRVYCPACNAVFKDGRWQWAESWPADAHKETCQACHRTKDNYPAGARFVIEIPALVQEPELVAARSGA